MSWCDTCTNTDGAECIGCQGWRKGTASDAPRRLLEVTPPCACGDIDRQGWVHRPSHCWPYDEPSDGVATVDPVREALRNLVAALREYATFPPKVLPALKAAEAILAITDGVGGTRA